MRIQKRTVLSTAERRQRLLLFLFGIILCGVAVHTLLLRRMPDASVCQVLFRYLLPTEQLDQARWVLAAARQGIFFLLGWFLLGFSAVGQPGAVFLLGGYGMSLGKILMQAAGNSSGSWLHLPGILVYYSPFSIWMVLAARESLRFSLYFTRYGFQDAPEEQMRYHLRMYLIRFLVLLLFLCVFSLLYRLGDSGVRWLISVGG